MDGRDLGAAALARGFGRCVVARLAYSGEGWGVRVAAAVGLPAPVPEVLAALARPAKLVAPDALLLLPEASRIFAGIRVAPGVGRVVGEAVGFRAETSQSVAVRVANDLAISCLAAVPGDRVGLDAAAIADVALPALLALHLGVARRRRPGAQRVDALVVVPAGAHVAPVFAGNPLYGEATRFGVA